MGGVRGFCLGWAHRPGGGGLNGESTSTIGRRAARFKTRLERIAVGAQLGARTLAAGDPAVAFYNGEFHVDYRATNGTIKNMFWNGSNWVRNTVPAGRRG